MMTTLTDTVDMMYSSFGSSGTGFEAMMTLADTADMMYSSLSSII